MHSTRHMNFFKRATTSIIRRPGKTIILLLLVFILGSVIAGAISVEGAISNTDANLRRNMQPIVSIDFDDIEWNESIDWDNFDWENDPDPWFSRPSITPEEVRSIGRLPYVHFYDFVINSSLRSFDYERYTGDGMMSWGSGDHEPMWFDLRGTSATEMVQIDQGIIEMVQGNQFNQFNLEPGQETATALISREFAAVNDLSVGSRFTLYEFIHTVEESGDNWCWGSADCFDENERLFAQIGMEFEVIGIYEVPIDDEEDQWQRIDRSNLIFVPNWAIEDIQRRILNANLAAFEEAGVELPSWFAHAGDEDRETSVLPLFILEDPADIDDFKAAAASYLPSEFHYFIDMSSAFDDIASSMATMQNIANWILYVSIGATLLILSLLITLFLRDRRYEMGVYLALGEKKGKIISQILMEVLVTSFVAITLSVFVGNFISSQVSRNMLMNELQADNNDPNFGMMHRWGVFEQIGIPTNSMSVDEMIEAYDVSLTPAVIGMFYVIGLGAVVVSSLIPVIYVVTLNPKKVLM